VRTAARKLTVYIAMIYLARSYAKMMKKKKQSLGRSGDLPGSFNLGLSHNPKLALGDEKQ
jgi:hypothetical protein